MRVEALFGGVAGGADREPRDAGPAGVRGQEHVDVRAAAEIEDPLPGLVGADVDPQGDRHARHRLEERARQRDVVAADARQAEPVADDAGRERGSARKRSAVTVAGGVRDRRTGRLVEGVVREERWKALARGAAVLAAAPPLLVPRRHRCSCRRRRRCSCRRRRPCLPRPFRRRSRRRRHLCSSDRRSHPRSLHRCHPCSFDRRRRLSSLDRRRRRRCPHRNRPCSSDRRRRRHWPHRCRRHPWRRPPRRSRPLRRSRPSHQASCAPIVRARPHDGVD